MNDHKLLFCVCILSVLDGLLLAPLSLLPAVVRVGDVLAAVGQVGRRHPKKERHRRLGRLRRLLGLRRLRTHELHQEAGEQ